MAQNGSTGAGSSSGVARPARGEDEPLDTSEYERIHASGRHIGALDDSRIQDNAARAGRRPASTPPTPNDGGSAAGSVDGGMTAPGDQQGGESPATQTPIPPVPPAGTPIAQPVPQVPAVPVGNPTQQAAPATQTTGDPFGPPTAAAAAMEGSRAAADHIVAAAGLVPLPGTPSFTIDIVRQYLHVIDFWHLGHGSWTLGLPPTGPGQPSRRRTGVKGPSPYRGTSQNAKTLNIHSMTLAKPKFDGRQGCTKRSVRGQLSSYRQIFANHLPATPIMAQNNNTGAGNGGAMMRSTRGDESTATRINTAYAEDTLAAGGHVGTLDDSQAQDDAMAAAVPHADSAPVANSEEPVTGNSQTGVVEAEGQGDDQSSNGEDDAPTEATVAATAQPAAVAPATTTHAVAPAPAAPGAATAVPAGGPTPVPQGGTYYTKAEVEQHEHAHDFHHRGKGSWAYGLPGPNAGPQTAVRGPNALTWKRDHVGR
ncbi:hypothetical protein M409DRAFT_57166 [Zasmidium cellare ATCC 36951]|uniref:Uncharacterized protein n=1 Tax=Zasmidium cellare ATCC 36951 TaxID=1080233 RepID=A0A6A6CCM0_ZASCE|nr:uncharacterized protein M409DRAFT_57166 [Zasmidium cellare ATCC 36951]KAF2163662.1 hypothetical protein M409DRAFT_57166 [Zasmidium cellare ATCC 36951]